MRPVYAAPHFVYHHTAHRCAVQSKHFNPTEAIRECERLNEVEDSIGHYYTHDVYDWAASLCLYHAGKPYNDVRSSLQSVDFGDCYPEVDSDGCLTGECIPGDTDGYSICDIDSEGNVQRHEHAIEAVIED